MKNIEQLIENRVLSGEQAMRIAISQTDLGGTSQQDMILVMSGTQGKIKNLEDWNKARHEAFNRLDPLSQIIVHNAMNGDLQEAEDNLSYCLNQIGKARDAVRKINNED